MVEIWTPGWDQSHYDEPMEQRDGMDLVTHKLTEGDHFYADAEYQAGITRAHVLGVSVLGSYHVQHGARSITRQADWWFSSVDLLSPWWVSHPAWTWQIDAEKFDYMTAPTIAEINALGDAICARAKCPAERVIAYAPEWLYGSKLAGLRYRQWESSYVSGSGPYRGLYPGNGSVRWNTAAPGGRAMLLQYTSSAIIAGQTTCDANAFPGSLSQLLTAIKAGPQPAPTDPTEPDMLRFQIATDIPGVPAELNAGTGWTVVLITDGAWWRPQLPPPGEYTSILNDAGVPPIIHVTKAMVPASADFDDVVSAICGVRALTGVPGPAGPAGPAGAVGPAGPAGAAGPAGPPADTSNLASSVHTHGAEIGIPIEPDQ